MFLLLFVQIFEFLLLLLFVQIFEFLLLFVQGLGLHEGDTEGEIDGEIDTLGL